MAKYAYNDKNILVDAASLALYTREHFHCSTPGCNAAMFPRNTQKKSACFVSYNSSDHIGGHLCKVKDHFKPDEYDESLFTPDTCFARILAPTERNEHPPHHGEGGVGHNRHIAITTLKMMYLMCVQYRDGGSYNGFDINDMLIDRFNPSPYPQITGNWIIATTFRKYDNAAHSIYMDNPNGRHNELIKIHVSDNKMFIKCRQKIYDPTHNNIFVIAGNWSPSNDLGCLIECELTSVGKQICKGD